MSCCKHTFVKFSDMMSCIVTPFSYFVRDIPGHVKEIADISQTIQKQTKPTNQ